ncbi:MAG: hypothetical protein M1828_000413 [Chrysothrix sp. TS-e1954]|nr:MAG: hypothetical protein M1828_000413 [Chrysothrix sp. TS-e1954]
MYAYVKKRLDESIIFQWLLSKIMSWLGGERSAVVGKLTGTYQGSLTCIDNRTGERYDVPIVNNSIPATAFTRMKAPPSSNNTAEHPEDGIVVYDSGFQNTAVTESKVTYVDGKSGKIQFRNWPIQELVGNKTYEDIAYMLNWGEFPSDKERETFRRALAATAGDPCNGAADVIHAFPRDGPPIMMLIAGCAGYVGDRSFLMPSHEGKNLYMGKMDEVDKRITEILAHCTTLVAHIFCHQHSMEWTPPDPNESYIYNLLLMMGKVDPKTKKPNPKHVNCLERLWVLYADHEMTNSTANYLHAASTLADPVSCGISAMASAYGPLHGGAIDMVYNMLREIGGKENIPPLIERVKQKKQRLYGYGHRIYKTTDPRSSIIRQILSELLEDGPNDPLLDIAMEIDRVASEDEYFTSRKLAANADLYGSFVYTALGFPPDIILPLAIVSRLPGLLAHWREAMLKLPNIWRPKQIFTGKVVA